MSSVLELPLSARAQSPSAGTSSKYSFVQTTEIVDALADNGWRVSTAVQTRSRENSKRYGFQKHMLRFRPEDDRNAIKVGDSIAELLLINSHDATSAYKFMGGIYRLVCGNGMVVCEDDFGGISLRHQNTSLEEIIRESLAVAARLPELARVVSAFKKVTLNELQELDFARRALEIRFGDKQPLLPADIITPRRNADTGRDLWTIFNKVQEHVIRGGQMGVRQNGVITATRSVEGLSTSIELNEALWALTREFAEAA